MRFLIFIILLSHFSFAQTKDRYNYIQKPTSTTVTVAWRTSTPGISVIRWGLDSLSLNDSIENNNSIRKHVFEITNLDVNTKYYYQTETRSIFTSSIEYFSTAKKAASNQFSFLHYGDCGYNNTIQNDIAKLMQADTVDFGIVAGDVDQGRGNKYDEVYFGPYKNLLKNTCHYTCLGNHDRYADKGKTYLDEFYLPSNNSQKTEQYYSYTWGNAKFICLDSNIPYTEGTAQYNWLVEELKCNDKQWLFTFFHHPPWTNAWSWDYWIPFSPYFIYKGNKDMRTSLVPLFEQYNVDFVLNGHSHCYQRGEMNGVKYVISGGAGAKKLDKKKHKKSPNIDTEIYVNQYVRFDVNGNTVKYTAIDIDGNVIDEVTTTKTTSDLLPSISQDGSVLTCRIKGEYNWFLDGIQIPNANKQSFEMEQSGSYEVLVTNEQGCSLFSSAFKGELK